MMKKNKLWIALLAIVIFSPSCKKDNPNSWTFEGVTYTADAVNTTGSNILVAYNNASECYLSFTFSTLPLSAGSYRVVSSSYPGSGQVFVSFANLKGGSYRSADTDSINAAVTVSNGKIGISFSNLQMTSNSDTSRLSAHISE